MCAITPKPWIENIILGIVHYISPTAFPHPKPLTPPSSTLVCPSRGIHNEKSYITMMQVRAYIIHTSNEALAMACTIAIRYSVVRRQGYDADSDDVIATEGKEQPRGGTNAHSEFQVLDYRQQQYRLLPLLAASYATFFTGKHVLARLKDVERRLVSGDASITKTVVADIHATTSALKSYITTFTADGIEDCRKACGGHGFLVCSGLVELSNTYLQSCTVEGDNQMLPQQVIKVLLKLVGAIRSGQDLAAVATEYEGTDMHYLIGPLRASMTIDDFDDATSSAFTFPPDAGVETFLDVETLLTVFGHRSACLLFDVARQLQSSMGGDDNLTAQQAWNDALPSMARASRAHATYLILRDFRDGLSAEEERRSTSCLGPDEVAVMRRCIVLLALYWMDKFLDDFLQIRCLSPSHVPTMRLALMKALTALRPCAVGLCDARDFHDFRLKSALGRYDGDVYPAIMKAARRDPLNNATSGGEVGPGYESLRRLIVDGVGKYCGRKGDGEGNGENGYSGTVSRL
jgi:acyl-CoA oxidase